MTDRDRPIARIVPVLPRGTSAVVLRPTQDFAVVHDRTRVPAEWGISSTEMLPEERLRTVDRAIGFEVMT